MTQKQKTFREYQKYKYFKYWTGSTLKKIKKAERENEKSKLARKCAVCQEKQMGTNQKAFFKALEKYCKENDWKASKQSQTLCLFSKLF